PTSSHNLHTERGGVPVAGARCVPRIGWRLGTAFVAGTAFAAVTSVAVGAPVVAGASLHGLLAVHPRWIPVMWLLGRTIMHCINCICPINRVVRETVMLSWLEGCP